MTDYGVNEREVFRCLKILQSFEPDGVGSRSLNECLWIQIDHYDLDDSDAVDHLKEFVKHHLEDISDKAYGPMLAKLSISQSQLDDYIDFISHLNPNPAAQYSQGNTQVIQPSLRIEINDGVLSLVNLEEERMSVSLNESMLKQLEQAPTPELQKELNQAKVWVDHFNKRQQLLKFCGEYLIKKAAIVFFGRGSVYFAVPSKDMAVALDVSESTISRLVQPNTFNLLMGLF